MSKPPIKLLNMAPAGVEVEELSGGAFVLSSPQELAAHERCVGEMLVRWAAETPDAVFLADRTGPEGSWRKVSYAQAMASVLAIAQALLDRGLSAEHPVAILSDNAVDNGLLQMGAMHAGVPVAPISPAYSLMSQDLGKLKYIASLVTPGLVYAADGAKFERALAIPELTDAEKIIGENPPPGMKATSFAGLLATKPTPAVDQAFNALTQDSMAKILFTSGSTGQPKGVINTQRMLCSSQQAAAQLWPFLEDRPPVTVDWLPWNHTFGANHNFFMMLRNGGAIYVDEGKPAPGIFDATVANLTDISPTIYFNVPLGFDLLANYLESDEALRRNFFSQLDMIFYAAAALPQSVWERLENVSIKERGERVMMVSAWGSTETSPLATSVHFPIERAGVIGLPIPGTEIKMVPSGDKLELRVRGPSVTPGYWKRDDLTSAAFDDDGFYRIGDAGRLEDTKEPTRGIVFDGRVSEDFKLTSGTWVHVGALRVNAIAAAPGVIRDCVITGQNRGEVGILIFPNMVGCAALVPGAGADTPLAELISATPVRDALAAGLKAHNGANPGSSTRIRRAMILAAPPDIDANEITDKGYLNQRAVLEKRAELVVRLHTPEAAVDDEILVFE
ncbi:MAG: feruloyl-CoA synthase [Rhodospirillales bacterium]|nr:feruloyl-CoA synthase [Rhodospirillales bacterium]